MNKNKKRVFIILIVLIILIFSILKIFLLFNNNSQKEVFISQGQDVHQIDFVIPDGKDIYVQEIPILFNISTNIFGIYNPDQKVILVYKNNKYQKTINLPVKFKNRAITGIDYSSVLGYVIVSIQNLDLNKILFDENIDDQELINLGYKEDEFIQIHWGQTPGENLIQYPKEQNDKYSIEGIFQDLDILVEYNSNLVFINNKCKNFKVNTNSSQIKNNDRVCTKDVNIKQYKNAQNSFIISQNTSKTYKYELQYNINLKDLSIKTYKFYVIDKDKSILKEYNNIIDMDINLSINRILLLEYDQISQGFIVHTIDTEK